MVEIGHCKDVTKRKKKANQKLGNCFSSIKWKEIEQKHRCEIIIQRIQRDLWP